MTEPTPGEIWRRLDDVVKRVEEAVHDVREFRNWAERLYVPRMEWVEARRALNERIDNAIGDVNDLKLRAEDDRKFRRQVLGALAIAAFSAVVSIGIAFMTLLLGR